MIISHLSSVFVVFYLLCVCLCVLQRPLESGWVMGKEGYHGYALALSARCNGETVPGLWGAGELHDTRQKHLSTNKVLTHHPNIVVRTTEKENKIQTTRRQLFNYKCVHYNMDAPWEVITLTFAQRKKWSSRLVYFLNGGDITDTTPRP